MHWSGEVNLATLISGVLLLLAVGAVFLRLGGLQAVLTQLVMDGKQVAAKLLVHETKLEAHQAHDELLFREMTATLNQLVGKIDGRQ